MPATEMNKLVVGQVVLVKSFAFNNPQGGTGLSDWNHNPRFEGIATVRITKRWDDYETGERAWAEPVSDSLKKYIERNADPKDKRVFVGEFDLAPLGAS